MAGCTSSAGTSHPPVEPLVLTDTWPHDLLSSTWLRIAGEGLPLPSDGDLTVTFEAATDGGTLSVHAPAEVSESATTARAPLGPALSDAGAPLDTPLSGRLVLERSLPWARWRDQVEIPVTLVLRRHVDPVLHTIAVSPQRPGDTVVVEAEGLLLPEEGTTVAHLWGVIRTGAGPSELLDVESAPLTSSVRERGSFRLDPAWLPDVPATIEGSIEIVDTHADGTVRVSSPLDISWSIAPPRIDAVTPDVVRRGQWLRVRGAGLLAPDETQGALTALVLEGTFDPTGESALEAWQGRQARVWFADGGPGDTEVWVAMRALAEAPGAWWGPAARPGRFDGTARVAIAAGPQWLWSEPVPLTLRIARPLQLVWLRYLPGFTGAMAEFGLAALEPQVRQRIGEVLARDYDGISIAFTETRPQDWFEYSVVEVGGDDPNGAGLLGLDNTAGKDEGNLRFDDVVGGFNAQTDAQGFYPYGGIFASSFFQFSPTLGGGANPLEDDRFDAIFAPFAPALGGQPIAPEELAANTQRAAAARDAATVLGNLLGGTVAHEVGHTLGLSAEPGRFHNEGDHPNWLMDAGIYRPFGERAEIDGEGPELFSPTNRAYLLQILPPDEGGTP